MNDEKLPVKIRGQTLDRPMTRAQAQRYGDRRIDPALKRAGFKCFVVRSDPEMHGGNWFRVVYGK